MPGATPWDLVPLADVLDRDARPSFIVDLKLRDALRLAHMPVVYCNPALRAVDDLVRLIGDRSGGPRLEANSLDFSFWVTQVATASAETQPVLPRLYNFCGVVWSVIALDNDFLYVSGVCTESINAASSGRVPVVDNLTKVMTGQIMAETIAKPPAKANGHSNHDQSAPPDVQRARAANLGILSVPHTPHIDFFLTIDWASTSVGPIATWPPEIHVMCNLVMTDPDPAFLFLGDELITVHNEAATVLFPHGRGHMMGNTFERFMPEAYKAFAAVFERLKTEHTVERMTDQATLVVRNGGLDECFISGRYLPVVDAKGKYLGIYQSLREVTSENLYRRRLATFLQVSTCASNVRKLSDFWHKLIDTLSASKQDVAFAMVYSVDTAVLSKPLARGAAKSCTLEARFNIEEGHPGAPLSVDLSGTGTTSYSAGFRQALEKDAPVYLDVNDGSLPTELVDGIKCLVYSALSKGVTICPIRPSGSVRTVAFVVIGLSARVARNEEYQQFIDILNRQIAHAVASLTLLNEEIARSSSRAAEAAEIHAQLRRRLTLQEQQLLYSETRFQRMTDKMPIGVTSCDREGNIVYANKAFYDICGHSGTEVTAESWIALAYEEDQQKLVDIFSNAWQSLEHVTFEMRMKKPWVKEVDGADTITTDTWLLTTAYVEVGSEGAASYLMSAITDISAQKWAEEIHHRRMVEALELKRQQENFIDTISHEIRNPLSAILQCTDEISEHLASTKHMFGTLDDSLRGCIEAVETITLCSQHQRRVIDDVLMLSKINSDMLTICTGPTDPRKLVDGVVQMFHGQARKHGISLRVVAEDSFTASSGEYLMLDSGRIMQVLVNLVGNAIKFTRGGREKVVKIIYGLLDAPPSEDDHGVQYMTVKLDSRPEVPSDVSSDKNKYLRIIVQDTGVGMSGSQKTKLFKRFSQASPRTYVSYGGSGLGLYISKQLSELQGGAIGLRMDDGPGATFAFYVATHATSDGDQQTLEGIPVDAMTLIRNLDIHDTPSVLESPFTVAKPVPTTLQPMSAKPEIGLLVVEDNLINQRVMVKQLLKRGYTVHTANHGVEALAFLKTTDLWAANAGVGATLSVILLDIEMPVMNGLECASRIRLFERDGSLIGHMPIISVSANARSEQVEDAKKAGVDDNISKPFRIEELVPKIEQLLARTNHKI